MLSKSLKNIVMLTSLSKRSNVPGLRSGFAAGDSELIKSFYCIEHIMAQQ